MSVFPLYFEFHFLSEVKSLQLSYTTHFPCLQMHGNFFLYNKIRPIARDYLGIGKCTVILHEIYKEKRLINIYTDILQFDIFNSNLMKFRLNRP